MANNFEQYGIAIPAGAKGNVKTLCPQCSKDRQKNPNEKCLSVHIEKGIWNCKNCPWTGSIKNERKQERVWRPVESMSNPVAQKIVSYFESRGITNEVIERNRITQTVRAMNGVKRSCICFNYYVDDVLVNVKFRDGAKEFSQVTGGEAIAYKINDLDGVGSAIITEGEIDALSYEVAGYRNAVSMPNGAVQPKDKTADGKLKFLELCEDWFTELERIYLATDADAPGLRTREEIARRLGRNRCYIVSYPHGCKDANEVLVKYGADALAETIRTAEPYPIEGAHEVREFTGTLYHMHQFGLEKGVQITMGGLHQYFTFFPGDEIIITGESGSGKSNMVDQMLVELAVEHSWRTAYFTPENEVQYHLLRMTEILIGKPFLPGEYNQMPKNELTDALTFLQEHAYYIMPKNGIHTIDMILELAESFVRRKGITALVIDPWNTIAHVYLRQETETNYIARELNRLKWWGRNHGVTVFIVAHPRKPDAMNSTRKPTLNDVAGSVHFRNVPDNGFIVDRVFEKEGKGSHNVLMIAKVKHKFMGRIGKIELDFDASCQRFRTKGKPLERANMLAQSKALEPPSEPESNIYVPSDGDPF